MREVHFDYVIVGGGSAGCVLANRLSADGAAEVLLLEAGGKDNHPYLRIPIGVGKLREHHLFDWGYESEPEEGFLGRKAIPLRGKLIGGCHSINHMNHTRGHPGDFDNWAAMGATGWSYKEFLPYLKAIETFEGGGSEWRGGAGPMKVRWSRYKDPCLDAWREAGIRTGIPKTDDYNGEQAEGFGPAQVTEKNGKRHSSARAYLLPVMGRKNLKVLLHAHTTRILMQGTRATGVEFRQGSETLRAIAGREVILSAGVYNTPQLMMLSGIGPAAHLREQGIEPVADLPVGDNLQDHVGAWFTWKRREPGPFQGLLRADRIVPAMVQAMLFGTGPATVQPMAYYAFTKTLPDLAVPDIELIISGAGIVPAIWFPGVRKPVPETIAIRPALLHPKSRGQVRLRSTDPFAAPRIKFNYLTEPEDIATLLRGAHKALKIAHHPVMAPFRGEPVGPREHPDDATIEDWIRRNAQSFHHACGTCAIGPVVAPDLKVHGIEALRVVDASVMPTLVSAHINATVMAIAEKGAEMVRS